MNSNRLAFVTVVCATTAQFHSRNTLRKKNRQLAHSLEITNQCFEIMSELARNLMHQNQYMAELLDKHNIPVDEFDKIAMSYHRKDK